MIQLQRLNMDNSWFINFDDVRLIVDPWLTGKEVDFFPWFNTQWHRTKPVELDQLPPYDFVLITQKYPDHFHRETLQLMNPEKIIVPGSVQKTCIKWLPEAEVVRLNKGIKKLFGSKLNLHFLPTSRKLDPIYDALILENGKKSIFLASHGFSINKQQIQMIRNLPPFALLITPFNRYKLPALLGGVVSPGLEKVQELVQVIDPEKVVATHDEDKFAKGIVSKFARINRAPEVTELEQLSFLKGRVLDVKDYKPTSLS